MNRLTKAALAEMVGTFAFFTVGAGAICTDQMSGGKVGLVGIAIAHGFILSNMINVFGPISGGHFNPAVTFGAWIGRQLDTKTGVVYIVAQLVGGVLAGLLLIAMFPAEVWGPVHLGTPGLAEGVSPLTGVVAEAAFTFFLVLSVYGTGIDHRSPNVPTIGGYGIGLTLMVAILVGGPITGGAANPARTFGPALVAGFWEDHWVYWVGPMLGGAIAGLLYSRLFLEKKPQA